MQFWFAFAHGLRVFSFFAVNFVMINQTWNEDVGGSTEGSHLHLYAMKKGDDLRQV
jgi:hypothetical protein